MRPPRDPRLLGADLLPVVVERGFARCPVDPEGMPTTAARHVVPPSLRVAPHRALLARPPVDVPRHVVAGQTLHHVVLAVSPPVVTVEPERRPVGTTRSARGALPTGRGKVDPSLGVAVGEPEVVTGLHQPGSVRVGPTVAGHAAPLLGGQAEGAAGDPDVPRVVAGPLLGVDRLGHRGVRAPEPVRLPVAGLEPRAREAVPEDESPGPAHPARPGICCFRRRRGLR